MSSRQSLDGDQLSFEMGRANLSDLDENLFYRCLDISAKNLAVLGEQLKRFKGSWVAIILIDLKLFFEICQLTENHRFTENWKNQKFRPLKKANSRVKCIEKQPPTPRQGNE